jgi:hypothetical protein
MNHSLGEQATPASYRRSGGRKFTKEPKRTHHVLIDPDISLRSQYRRYLTL